jgi:release factor glutamine methyltransferase
MTHIQALFRAHPLPRLEQLALAAHALEKPRSWLLAHDLDVLSASQLSAVTHALQRRASGEPVAYIVGTREFYGLNFTVSPAVLIPRPETELLVDYLIEHTLQAARVLDLGTGSGAIAMAVFAADISQSALAIAAQNNAALVDQRVNLRLSDWLSAFAGETFDVIVSNPPYIAASDAHLQQGDLRFEPANALTDFEDGLSHYRRIGEQARQHLNPGGRLLLEHGWQQGAALSALLKDLGYRAVTQRYDAAEHGQQGHARLLTAKWVH